MSSSLSPASAAQPAPTVRRRGSPAGSLLARGEPSVWLTGGALALALTMVLGLIALIVIQGMATFWPTPLVKVTMLDGSQYLGAIIRREPVSTTDIRLSEKLSSDQRQAVEAQLAAGKGSSERILLAMGNQELSARDSQYLNRVEIQSEDYPEWAILCERLSQPSRFVGYPKSFQIDGKTVASTPAETWAAFVAHHSEVRAAWRARQHLQSVDLGIVNAKLNTAELERKIRIRRRDDAEHALKLAQILVSRAQSGRDAGADLAARKADVVRIEAELAAAEAARVKAEKSYEMVYAECTVERQRVEADVAKQTAIIQKYQISFVTDDQVPYDVTLEEIVRAIPGNQLTFFGRLGVYLDRWHEFLFDVPRQANSAGGVFPAIFGTVILTLMMTIVVIPFGVVTALFLREYAWPGVIVSTVRIAINNLAGVPSIVFGVFGLGFFCYVVGAGIDDIFFSSRKIIENQPTFGKEGILWASMTLALLTVPVVIVATEEALAAVPKSMREGSYACGASKWQTIQRIVLPRAMPGIMTGAILAMARGAGEVAPLMLVGAVKSAQDLPVDSIFPYFHFDRTFMHLGFHIFDVGLQSPDSQASLPMVYTTTLLLIAIIATLNLMAVWLRAQLRRKFAGAQF